MKCRVLTFEPGIDPKLVAQVIAVTNLFYQADSVVENISVPGARTLVLWIEAFDPTVPDVLNVVDGELIEDRPCFMCEIDRHDLHVPVHNAEDPHSLRCACKNEMCRARGQ